MTLNDRLVACMRTVEESYRVKADIIRRDATEGERTLFLDAEADRVSLKADGWERNSVDRKPMTVI